MSKQIDLSIIIVNWNTCDLLRDCLKSLNENFSSFSREIIVVDNASTDQSVQMVNEEFPGVTPIKNDRNVGFAAANNQGIRASSGRFVLLLNPDTRVQPGALEALVAALDNDPAVGAVGPRLLNPDGSVQRSYSSFPTARIFLEWFAGRHKFLRPLHRLTRTRLDHNNPHDVDAPLGACLMIKREVLDKVGLLDEGYFMYAEELDLCRRIRQAGGRARLVPSAEVIHVGGAASRQSGGRAEAEWVRSHRRFVAKHCGLGTRVVLEAILCLESLWRTSLKLLKIFRTRMDTDKHG